MLPAVLLHGEMERPGFVVQDQLGDLNDWRFSSRASNSYTISLSTEQTIYHNYTVASSVIFFYHPENLIGG